MPEHVYNPKLKHRSVPHHPTAPEGAIHLDVVVTDPSGKPVPGLSPQDFTLLDDNLPRKIVSFQGIDGRTARPDPPVEAILLIDQLNTTFQQFSFARSEIARFLRKNNGNLPLPVSIALLSESGLRMQRGPSLDGSACLAVLDQVKGNAGNIDPRLSRLSSPDKSRLSVQELAKLAGIESKKPGRKLLIWMSPGWTINPDGFGGRDKQLVFNTIIEISNMLREARTVVYSVSSDNPITSISGLNQTDDLNTIATTLDYESFLKPVRTPEQALRPSLYLKVFAVHSGGRILGPDNDLVGQIEKCVQDAATFYRISFDTAPPRHLDEYHDLKIQISRPGLTAHTNTGYYNEPSWK